MCYLFMYLFMDRGGGGDKFQFDTVNMSTCYKKLGIRPINVENKLQKRQYIEEKHFKANEINCHHECVCKRERLSVMVWGSKKQEVFCYGQLMHGESRISHSHYFSRKQRQTAFYRTPQQHGSIIRC